MVHVYLDKHTRRITATAKLDRYLDRTPPRYRVESRIRERQPLMRTLPRPLNTAPEAWLPDAWIIEEELRRERQERERPYLELPLPTPETYSDPETQTGPDGPSEAPTRGVVIIDL